MAISVKTPRERAGIVVRPLRLDVLDRFRAGAAARHMTQAQHFEALLDLADDLRDAAARHDDSVAAGELLERHGLGRVTL